MCLALGIPHPDHLAEILTPRQYAEWLTYNYYEPIGEHRADTRIGMVCSWLKYVYETTHSKTPASVEFQEPGSHFRWLSEDMKRFRTEEVSDDTKLEDLPFEERARLVREMAIAAFSNRGGG